MAVPNAKLKPVCTRRKRPNGQLLWSRILVFVGCFFLLVPALPGASGKIAFLGDSITTGAVTHPNLVFDRPKLWNYFRGQGGLEPDAKYFNEISGLNVDRMEPPIRLRPTLREYFGPSAFIGSYIVNAFSSTYLDTEEYSWAYMLGRELDYHPQDILIAAQDGERVAAGSRQVDRILSHTDGQLPGKIFIFFTGNDLCGPAMEMTTSAADYASSLSAVLRYLFRNGNPANSATEIYVLGFIGIVQLTSNPKITEKKIFAHGQETTCKKLGEMELGDVAKFEQSFLTEAPEAAWFSTVFPGSPATVCPTIFGMNPDFVKGQSGTLANRIRNIRKESKKVVANYQKILASRADRSKFKLFYLDGTSELLFEGDEIAEDCFHLSAKGQKRVAKTVLDELSTLP